MDSDALVKVVLVLFISLISLSVGTFIGKQVSDADHARMALEVTQDQHDELSAALEKTERDYAEAKEIDTLNKSHAEQPCTQYQLSPRKQIERVNEILGTPTEKKVGQP